MVCSTGFSVIRSKNRNIPNELIYLSLTDSNFINQMQQIAEQSVSTFPSIRPSDLDLCILTEPEEKNTNYINTIQYCFNCIATLQEENRKLSNLRELLLPKLMSGEIDVSNLEL